MQLTEILEKAKAEIAAATGLKSASVTQVSKDDGRWCVRVEMLEMSRMPPSTDLLGDYEVLLTEDGDMLGFQRKRTRLRAAPVDE